MMLRLLVFVFVIIAVLIVSCHPSPTVKWPKKYGGHISRISVMSGLTEEIDLWVSKENYKSRIDYNDGAVKSFIIGNSRFTGTAYEILPVTEAGAKVITYCNSVRLGLLNYKGPQTLFPNLNEYVYQGEEMMREKKCAKLVHKVEDSTKDKLIKKTVWAYFDDKVDGYLPVRHEILVYNTWLGQNSRHDIYDFYDFHGDFDEDEVFNPGKYCNDDEAVVHQKDDESITKHLMFINPENRKHVNHVFEAFKRVYNVTYEDHKEHIIRKNIFQDNMRLIRSTNLKNLGYKLAVNRFADLLPDEMRKYTGRLPRPKGEVGTHAFPYDEAAIQEKHSTMPDIFDLRDLGYVTPVENQEQCGSCWTFGTTAAVEGALARTNGGVMMSLAKQALIDCGWEFGASGCYGGTDTAAYKLIMEYGLPTEADYGTYEGQDGYCKIKNMTKTYKIHGFVDVTPENIPALKVALYEHGPLSVSIHATDAFAIYSSGIFYDLTCEKNPMTLNHEVTLVGYGEKDGEPYWVIKNSWGQDWGQAGYMQISARGNNCGIMTEPTYVLF